MKHVLYLAIVTGAVLTILLGLTSSNYAIDLRVLGVMVWVISPYLYLVAMAKYVSRTGAVIAVLALALLVGCFGVWAIVDPIILRVETDRVSFVFPPSWQWALLIIATPAIYFLNKERNA